MSPVLSAGGNIEVSLKQVQEPGYPETPRLSSFYPLHLVRALLHGAIIQSSQDFS